MACSAASESDAKRSQRQPSTNILVLPKRSCALACRKFVGSRTFHRQTRLTHATVACWHLRDQMEMPNSRAALAPRIASCSFFPIFCKRIVGSQHHMARWDLGYQEFQHVRIEQHGVVEEARQVTAEIALEMRGTTIT